MADQMDKEPLFFILRSIQEDIRILDEKWEKQIQVVTTQQEAISGLVDQIKHLNKVVHLGNGKPSHSEQLMALNNHYFELKKILSEMGQGYKDIKKDLTSLKDHAGIKEPHEVKLEKWKTVGKVAGILALILPGILSFFGITG